MFSLSNQQSILTDLRQLYIPLTVFFASCACFLLALLLVVTAVVLLAGRPLFFGTFTDRGGVSSLAAVALAGLPRFFGVGVSATPEAGVLSSLLIDRRVRRGGAYCGLPADARFGRPVDGRAGSSASGMMETSPNRALLPAAGLVLAPAFLFVAGIVKRTVLRGLQ